MTLLTNWPTVWLMTGMGVGIVFCILIILVLILKFMGNINARTMGSTKASARKSAASTTLRAGEAFLVFICFLL